MSLSSDASRKRQLGQVIRWNAHVASERKTLVEQTSVELGLKDRECGVSQDRADRAAAALKHCSSGGAINVLQLEIAAESWIKNVAALEAAQRSQRLAKDLHEKAMADYERQRRKVSALEDLAQKREREIYRQMTERQSRSLEEGVARARWQDAQ